MRSWFSKKAAATEPSDEEKSSAALTLPGGLTLDQLRGELTDEQLTQQTEAVSAILDFREISDAEKQCAAQIIAMTLSNHTSRYYHYHRAIEARLICDFCQDQITTTVEAGTAKDVEQTDGGFRRISDFTLVSDDKARGACELPFYPRRIDRALFDELASGEPVPVDIEADLGVVSPSDTESDSAAPILAAVAAAADKSDEKSEGASEDVASSAPEPKRRSSIVGAMSESLSSMMSGSTLKCRCEQVRKSALIIVDGDLKRDLCAANLAWSHEIACAFAKYLRVADSQAEGLIYLCDHDDLVDPRTMLVALRRFSSSQFRLPLILIHFSIGHFGYLSARMRTLVKELLVTCNVDWQTWLAHERIFGAVLRSLLSDMSGDGAGGDGGRSAATAASRKKWKRWAKIGAAGVAGGVAIAFTGGLAAPAVAAGVATLGFTTAGAFLATSGGAATLTLVFGATGAGYAGKKAHNRLGDVNEFSLNRVSRRSGLNVVIGVCGFLIDKKKKKKDAKKDEIEDDKTEVEKSDSDKIDGDKADVETDKIDTDKTAVIESAAAAETDKAEVSEAAADDIESKTASDEVSEEVSTDTGDAPPPIGPELEQQCEEYWRKAFDRDHCDCDWRSDCYSLVFETEALRNLGHAMRGFAKDAVVSGSISSGAKYGLGYTAAGILVSALTWPIALLSIADVLDTPWGVCLSKAKDAGVLLANNIDNEKNGHRPVTLIGFSIGARVIYYACRELAKRVEATKADLRRLKRVSSSLESAGKSTDEKKSGFAASLAKVAPKKKESKEVSSERIRLETRLRVLKDKIENVVLFGAPCGGNADKWLAIREIVADRVVNCYSTRDWLLKFLYRSDQIYAADIAGLSPIKCPGVDNIDISHVVKGHVEYYDKVPELMRLLTQSGVLLF